MTSIGRFRKLDDRRSKMKLLFIALLGCLFFLQKTNAAQKSEKMNQANQSIKVEDKKIDILLVVDNSGSMSSSQESFAKAIGKFFDRLDALPIDYHIAVTGTDAWRATYVVNHTNKEMLKSLRVGPINFMTNPLSWKTNSGTRIVDRQTVNRSEVLAANAIQEIFGSGDERAFSSFQEVLNNTANSDFRRPDAFLSIIVLSDEDDFSANTSAFVAGEYDGEIDSDPVNLVDTGSSDDLFHLYKDPRLLALNSYKSFLEGLAGAGNYSFSAISIQDVGCKTQLNSSFGGRRIGRRYMELANLTQGMTGSLCAVEKAVSDYAEYLIQVADIAPEFFFIKLDRKPIVETIVVKVNGRLVPEDFANGWTFEESTLGLRLRGASIPHTDDIVSVSYDFDL